MKIEQFVKSLLPSIQKDTVLEDIRTTEGELKNSTIPAYDGSIKFFKTWKFKSDIVRDLETTWKRMVKGHSTGMVETIGRGMHVLLGNLAVVDVEIKKIYSDDTAPEGMTYLKAQLLQYVEMAGFASKYARELLNLIYVAETSEADSGETNLQDSIPPARIEWLKVNFVNFCTVFNAMTQSATDTSKAFSAIPDIVVTPDNAQTLPATVGMAKLDPMACGLIPVKLNPIYHIRMRIAEYQVRRYDSAKDELKLVQLRLLNLERILQNKPDPKIQKEIQYMEDRANKLAAKIAEMERDYA